MNHESLFLPDEVVVQILARLPVKSLLRTKTVCKRWYRLASDKYFIKLFNEISLKNQMVLAEVSYSSSESKSSLICVDNLKGVSEFSLDFLRDRVKIRASCNGLLCCSSIPDKGVYYVCNPSTRQYRLLPRSRERPVTRFYPDCEATLVGLACDLSNQKFNVVLAGYHRPFGQRSNGTFISLVYDSDSNKWRKSVSTQDECSFTLMNKNQVVFVNGMLHWLMGSSSSYMLTFDLNCHVWTKLLLPDEIRSGDGNRIYLLECEGCLSVVQISDSWMKIWKMEDYETELWVMVDRVSLRCIKGLVPGVFPVSQNNEYVFLVSHKQVLVYQRRSRLWKEMFSVKGSSSLPLWFSAYAFRSSILSFN